VLRYRTVVDETFAAVDRACRFLGISTGRVSSIPQDNSHRYVQPGWRRRMYGPVIRPGARAGQFASPQVWRRASAPLISWLSGPGETHRPPLPRDARQRMLEDFSDDVSILSQLTGEDFSDWLSTESRGSFSQRTQVTRS